MGWSKKAFMRRSKSEKDPATKKACREHLRRREQLSAQARGRQVWLQQMRKAKGQIVGGETLVI